MTIVSKTIKNLKNLKSYEVAVIILLTLYLVSGMSTPYELSPYVNNIFMYTSLFALSIVISLYGNNLLAIFLLFVALVFIYRSNKVSTSFMKPSGEKKDLTVSNLNKNSNNKTLEEEIVAKIETRPDNIATLSNYNPKECNTHNASKL